MTKNQWAIVGALAVCVVLEFCLIGIVAVNRLATPTEQDTGAIVMTPDGQIARADATSTRQAAKSLASTTAPPKNTPTATLGSVDISSATKSELLQNAGRPDSAAPTYRSAKRCAESA